MNQDFKARKEKKTAACEALDHFHTAALKVKQDNLFLQCFPTLWASPAPFHSDIRPVPKPCVADISVCVQPDSTV